MKTIRRKRIKTILSASLAALFIILTFASCGNGRKNGETRADQNGAAVVTFDADSASVSGTGASADGTQVRIESGGTYTVRGSTTDGQIVVDADGADVTLVLDGAQIASPKSCVIFVDHAKRATVYVKEDTRNSLTGGASDSEEEPNACICSNADLLLDGGGELTVVSREKGITAQKDVAIVGGSFAFDCADDAVHAKGSVAIRGGSLTAASGDDAIHAENRITVEDGKLDLTAHEGMEGTLVTINGGSIFIKASDDGVNAARQTNGVTPTVEINGGELEIVMEQGDTDGIDANGDIIINGGTIRITAQSAFDYEGKGELNGGTVYVNGEQVTKLTGQFGGMDTPDTVLS